MTDFLNHDSNDCVLAKRRYNGETYTFKLNRIDSWIHENGEQWYVTCDTPENCFGYSDTIMIARQVHYFTDDDKIAYHDVPYSLFRHCPNWILKKAHKVIDALTEKYIPKEYR